MVIALVVSFAALGYCIWLLRKMAVEIIALRTTLKALSTETATLANAFESVIWNVTVDINHALELLELDPIQAAKTEVQHI